uniref:Uncharacterized protein n=1 Tax=Arundo donax TaxID=35708 RepID=A0A0A9D420_ARUDO
MFLQTRIWGLRVIWNSRSPMEVRHLFSLLMLRVEEKTLMLLISVVASQDRLVWAVQQEGS